MKKLCAFFAGVLMFIGVVVGFKFHMDKVISDNKIGVREYRSYERYNSSEICDLIIDPNSLVILGSSELAPITDYNEAVGSFLNGEEMNIVTYGGGYFQSLSHAIEMASIDGNVPSKKIVLSLSPQWFTPEGCSPDAFSSRMSENMLLHLIYNKDISDADKEYVLQRVMTMLTNSQTQLARIQKYYNAYKQPFSLDGIYMAIMNIFWDYRAEYEVYKQVPYTNSNIPSYDLSSIDFQEILTLAEEQGKASCTNNTFGIYNEYWDTYVKETYEQGEVLEKQQVFTESVEYDDLRCFLNIARDLGYKVFVVHNPVNGRWYKFQGQLCDVYYENIRQILAEYNNVVLIDMTIYEDELYFLKDIMHLGWKGWARVNEELYSAFIEE